VGPEKYIKLNISVLLLRTGSMPRRSKFFRNYENRAEHKKRLRTTVLDHILKTSLQTHKGLEKCTYANCDRFNDP
jgi:hypothetical protein